MVNANRIKHLDGNGAALNKIANPPFLKVVSRKSHGCTVCLALDRLPDARLLSGLVDFSAVADLDDEHYVWWLDRVDDAPILHTQPPCTLEAVPQRLAKLDGVRCEFLFDGPADSIANVLG